MPVLSPERETVSSYRATKWAAPERPPRRPRRGLRHPGAGDRRRRPPRVDGPAPPRRPAARLGQPVLDRRKVYRTGPAHHLSDLLPDWGNPFRTEEVDRTGPAVLKALEDLHEYRAATGSYQVMVDIEKDAKSASALPPGRAHAVPGPGLRRRRRRLLRPRPRIGHGQPRPLGHDHAAPRPAVEAGARHRRQPRRRPRPGAPRPARIGVLRQPDRRAEPLRRRRAEAAAANESALVAKADQNTTDMPPPPRRPRLRPGRRHLHRQPGEPARSPGVPALFLTTTGTCFLGLDTLTTTGRAQARSACRVPIRDVGSSEPISVGNPEAAWMRSVCRPRFSYQRVLTLGSMLERGEAIGLLLILAVILLGTLYVACPRNALYSRWSSRRSNWPLVAGSSPAVDGTTPNDGPGTSDSAWEATMARRQRRRRKPSPGAPPTPAVFRGRN